MPNSKKVVLISGANRGIGYAIAEQLKSKYQLSLGMRKPEGSPFAQSAELKSFYYEASDDSSAEKWVNASLKQFGRIDALINCAGILRKVKFNPEEVDRLEELWEVNVRGPWFLSSLCLEELKKHSGKIINVSSLSGKRVAGASGGGYAMSKFALTAMSHALRHECWESGVRVTNLCPGFVNTDMVKEIATIDQSEMIQVEDLASTVEHLLDLPKTMSISDLTVNCRLERLY